MADKQLGKLTTVVFLLTFCLAACGRIEINYITDVTASPTKIPSPPTPVQTAVLEIPPTLVPTFTPEPTVSPTALPAATATMTTQVVQVVERVVTAVPTPSLPPPIINTPEISFFNVEPYQAMPGTTVTLSWAAYGQQATLCQIIPHTNETTCESVDLMGTKTITIPENTQATYLDFTLHVVENGLENTFWNSVGIVCHPDQWFFADPPSNCPADKSTSTHAAAQRFEYGLMIWLEDSNEIIVFFDDYERSFRVYPDTFLSEPEDIPAIEAPEELVTPERGFGIVWRGEAPNSADVRRRLGWGLAPEFNYQAVYQYDTPVSYPRFYLQTPDDIRVVEQNPAYWYVWNGW